MDSEFIHSCVVAHSCISFLTLLYRIPVNYHSGNSHNLCNYSNVDKYLGISDGGFCFPSCCFAITNNAAVGNVGINELSCFCNLIGIEL